MNICGSWEFQDKLLKLFLESGLKENDQLSLENVLSVAKIG